MVLLPLAHQSRDSTHRADFPHALLLCSLELSVMLTEGNLRGWAGLLHATCIPWPRGGWRLGSHRLVCRSHLELGMRTRPAQGFSFHVSRAAQGPALLNKLSGWFGCREPRLALGEHGHLCRDSVLWGFAINAPLWDILVLTYLPACLRISVKALLPPWRLVSFLSYKIGLFLLFNSVIRSLYPAPPLCKWEADFILLIKFFLYHSLLDED